MTINGFNNAGTLNKVQTSAGTNRSDLANNSGQGNNSPVLDIVSKRFNWGAFFLSWIWGLGNRTYITLLIFVGVILSIIIPVLGFFAQLGLCIWFGIKGNTWAWQNKKWKSIEHFHEVQKKWAIGGIIATIIFSIVIPAVVLCMVLPVLFTDTTAMENSTRIKMAANEVQQAVLMNEAMNEKCELTSEGLAQCFSKRMVANSVTGNSLTNTLNNTVFTFTGDGSCLNQGDCNVSIKTSKGDTAILPLYAKSNGHLEVKQEDVNKYFN